MPLGWHISVYRQADRGEAPAVWDSPMAARLAVWQTGLGGLDWVKALVERKKAISLGGNGYPLQFTAMAKHVMPHLAEDANAVWRLDPGDVVTDAWEGRTVIEEATVEACQENEWLWIEAWDES